MDSHSKTIETLSRKLNLSQSEKHALSQLITDLKKSWPQTRFRLFGSKVTGTADKESDLDLLILLPCEVTEDIRRQIIYKIFDLNLKFGSNISALIMSEIEWKSPLYSLLPIHAYIQEEGVSI